MLFSIQLPVCHPDVPVSRFLPRAARSLSSFVAACYISCQKPPPDGRCRVIPVCLAQIRTNIRDGRPHCTAPYQLVFRFFSGPVLLFR